MITIFRSYIKRVCCLLDSVTRTTGLSGNFVTLWDKSSIKRPNRCEIIHVLNNLLLLFFLNFYSHLEAHIMWLLWQPLPPHLFILYQFWCYSISFLIFWYLYIIFQRVIWFFLLCYSFPVQMKFGSFESVCLLKFLNLMLDTLKFTPSGLLIIFLFW